MTSTPARLRKAVLPVAGLGTRVLPGTKTTPKELLNVVDRPILSYIVEEAREAGIEHIVFVTGRAKQAIEDYFDHQIELEAQLLAKGKIEILEAMNAELATAGEMSFTRQMQPKGLGHAVWCARRLVPDNESVAVILTDDVIMGEPPCLQQMIEAHAETGGTMVATMEVPLEKTKSYGVLDVAEDMGAIVKAKGLVEKPKDNPPSNLAVIGRYILAPTVLQNLNKLREGAGGEIQLTDAIADEITEGREVFGLRFRGQRYDCGSKAGFLQATVAFGLERDELREEFLDYLNEVVSMQRAAE